MDLLKKEISYQRNRKGVGRLKEGLRSTHDLLFIDKIILK